MAKKSDKPGKVGLWIFGLFEICIGLFFGLIAIITFAMPKLPTPNPQVPMPNMLPIGLFELAIAAGIITLAVGTIMAKRWARKIMLILSWYGLIVGALAMIMLCSFMGPILDASLSKSGKLSPDTITGLKYGLMVGFTAIYVILPGIFVLFYRTQYVLSAVEYYDPKKNWMDACPTPVFAVSFFSAFGVLGVLLVLLMFGLDFPFFGVVFPVWGVALFLLFILSAMVYLTIGFYRVDMKAWWAAVILLVVGTVAYYFMFRMMDPATMYRNMHYTDAQIEQMKTMGAFTMWESMSSWAWLMLTPYLAYLLFIRKYFLKNG